MFYRLNTPTTFEMPLEILGHELQFAQVLFVLFLKLPLLRVESAVRKMFFSAIGQWNLTSNPFF
jgi:hypothetical protein